MTSSDQPTLTARASRQLMRLGRTMFRNTPLQRLPVVSALYRRLSETAYGQGGTTIVEFREIEIEIASGDITTLPSLADGTYESAELDRFLSYIRPGAVVADVGANIGIWSVLLSRAVGVDGKVFAFEPSPTNAELLRNNLVRNGCTNVEVVTAAVGRSAGRAVLDTTSPGATHHLAALGSAGDTPVDMVSLDDFLAASGASVDAVKIDIEGFEPEALAGMSGALSSRPVLLCEFSVPQARSAGLDWSASLVELLERYGSCEVFDGRSVQRVESGHARTLLDSKKLLNLLFTNVGR